jgi:hypothetical protein
MVEKVLKFLKGELGTKGWNTEKLFMIFRRDNVDFKYI